MGDHRTILAGLDPDIRASLTERSDIKGLTHLAIHLTGLSCTSLFIILSAPFWPVALALQGLLLTFLFTLAHECTHKTPFRTGWLNELVGRAAGLPLLLPFEWFRYFHLAHHRYTQNPSRDPELASGGPPTTWLGFLWHVSGIPFWAAGVRVLLQNAFATPTGDFVPAGSRLRLRREAQVLLVIYVIGIASFFWTSAIFWLWILPALIGQPFLRLFLLAEHSGCLRVGNMLVNTRTVATNRFVRFLAWNMPFHVEHHVLPAAPFHRLPELHSYYSR